jgi:hypothetical protein
MYHVSLVCLLADVRPAELGQLRADNMELAANLQVGLRTTICTLAW